MAAQQLAFPGSSYLSRGTYDPATQMLTVEFKSGAACEHRGVPQAIVDGLEAGGGSYYRSVLYRKYGAADI